MERRQRLLICFLFVFCVWPCLSLRAQVTDNAAAFHVFPAIADGQPSEGISFRSTLMVTNPSDSTSVTCTFRLYGLRTTFSGGHIIRIATDSFRITLARNDWDIAISQGTGAFASGYGSLSCDRPVTAQILYSLYVNSVKISEATVFSAPAGKIVQLLSDHRENARLGVAIANDTDRAVAYVLVVGDIDGKVIGSTTLTIPARSSIARFADDIFNGLPGNHVGQIIITSTDSSDVYAIGLRFTGNTFTTIPVTVRPATLATTASPPTLTSITPTSGSAGTTVNVTLTGTNFASGGTTLQVSGFGITVGSVQVNGPTSLTAIFTISASATAAGRTVTVTTSAGTSNGVTFNVSASSTSFNEFQARRLIGTWRFMYTIISGFTNTYRLNDVRPSTTTAGEWVIFGTDEVGDLVIYIRA